MKISSLKLVNFRNYSNVKLSFNDTLNIIYGNNGEGKTNLVEAIYTLSLTKSFRTQNDRNLIKMGEVGTKIEGEIKRDTNDIYELVINKEGKKVKINNNLVNKMSDYISKINIVLLQPEEQIIFNESPSERRKLLNIEISKIYQEYILYLNNYNKVLKQRNFYLRELLINGNASYDYLNILTNKLIDYGKKIYEYRNNFIININKYISKKYNEIFEKGNLVIKYKSDFNKSIDDLKQYYNKSMQKEINSGKTLFGIHHDDLIFLLDDKNIADWGSNGQRKNAIFSFKLALINVINELRNENPILILDDLFSALDNEKIHNIVRILNKDIQTFITTTNLENIDKGLIDNSKIFCVKSVDNECIIEEV